MLAGKGFTNIYNLAGGIKGWDSAAAIGSQDLGLSLFKGNESGPAALLVAYGLETGLKDFYATQEDAAKDPDVKALFKKLGAIEVKHQERIIDEYSRIVGRPVTREKLESQISGPEMEGGLTTKEYMNLFNPDLESVVDIVSIAMSIEAQALDLYMRAAANSSEDEGRRMLTKMADEEKTHMALLGNLLDDINN